MIEEIDRARKDPTGCESYQVDWSQATRLVAQGWLMPSWVVTQKDREGFERWWEERYVAQELLGAIPPGAVTLIRRTERQEWLDETTGRLIWREEIELLVLREGR